MVETRSASASQEDDDTSAAPSAENAKTVADDAFDGEGIVKVGEGSTEAERALREIERWEKKTAYLPKFLEGSLDGVEAGFGKAYTHTFEDDAAGARMQRAMLDHEDKRQAIGLTNRRKRETQAVETTGPKWFDMPKPKMTPELEKDLKVLRMRQHLDPSKHYKSTGWTGKGPAFFEAGTVVDSSHDYVAGRINRRERKQHLKDEILDDDGVRQRAKRRFHEVQAKTQSGRQGGPTKRPRKKRLAKR